SGGLGARLARGAPRFAWLLVAFVVGAGAGLLLLGRRSADPLTAERLAEARGLWESRGPTDYLLELEMRGTLEDTRVVEVRGGVVLGMTTGGREVAESAWPYWSVEGLFDTLETELANAERPGSVGAERIALLARFDPEWGYPSYFYRHFMGSLNDTEWEVVRFEAR
ncbi:MAG: DUF6174 domain-containing protein, partial [Thermoanaerobaculia bacterium]|nr:DUF6174 domain-containing protein [Thermoanaerobaculia bacterium]